MKDLYNLDNLKNNCGFITWHDIANFLLDELDRAKTYDEQIAIQNWARKNNINVQQILADDDKLIRPPVKEMTEIEKQEFINKIGEKEDIHKSTDYSSLSAEQKELINKILD